MKTYCFAIRNVPEIIRLRGNIIEEPEITDSDRYFVKRMRLRSEIRKKRVGWVEKKNVEAFWIEDSDS